MGLAAPCGAALVEDAVHHVARKTMGIGPLTNGFTAFAELGFDLLRSLGGSFLGLWKWSVKLV